MKRAASRSIALTGLLVSLLIACADSPTTPVQPQLLPDSFGVPFVGAALVTPCFSSDSKELLYTRAGTTTTDPFPVNIAMFGCLRNGDLYTVETIRNKVSLRWLKADTTLTVTDRAQYAGRVAEPPGIAVETRSGDLFYLVSPDSLFVRFADGRQRFVMRGCSMLWDVSPNGQNWLCANP